MTIISKLIALVAIGFVSFACYFAVWCVSTYDILGEVHFGYYGDFYIVKHALEKTGCIDSMEYSRHHDLTLEDFHFRVRTKSGRVVRVWFDEYRGDVDMVCSAPQGLRIVHPRNSTARDQSCTIGSILERLKHRNVKTVNLESLLCNIDELASVFEANYDSDSIERVDWDPKAPRRFSQYLRLEVVDESINKGGWIEIPIVRGQKKRGSGLRFAILASITQTQVEALNRKSQL